MNSAASSDRPLWVPDPAWSATTRMAGFIERARTISGRTLDAYADLHAWSVEQPEAFWTAIWEFCGVMGERGTGPVLVDPERMPGARWFPAARFNFAENLLQASANPEALVFWGEDQVKRTVSRAQLRREVARFTAALRDSGVAAGDRVAAYLPNLPETVVAMLAAASLGAVFTSASPDFGVQGVLDRFGQTEPKVLIASDGYWYNGRAIAIEAKLAELIPQLPSVRRSVVVPYLSEDADDLAARLPNAVSYARFLAPYPMESEPAFAPLPFDHPLYIMYSSGTTGVPKCIVHGVGGSLLQHLKEHQLHTDVREGDRLFYFTTCGWMMWNWLVSGLASGATLLLYDGNPFVDGGRILWDFAQTERITHFGTSAKYLDALIKTGLKPKDEYDLSALRVMTSTGSPLVAERFDDVYARIKSDLQLASISGGTDLLSCFVLGNPLLPVWRGEIQCKGLGLAVEVWDERGRPIRGEKGELVCARPFPSMPVGFWNDPDGKKYRAAYFERFPGVWHHGDFCEITERDGLIIHGRSDATLNPGGVRIGTAEIYRQVEKLSEVLEAIVIGQEWEGDVRVVLFVKLQPGTALDDALVARIKGLIREHASPRHVPAKVLQVTDIPRTKSGKIVELAVRDIVHGRPVKNSEALANPEALAMFENRVELRS